jgi:hypothetical protein
MSTLSTAICRSFADAIENIVPRFSGHRIGEIPLFTKGKASRSWIRFKKVEPPNKAIDCMGSLPSRERPLPRQPARSRVVYALCRHSFDVRRGHCPSDSATLIADSRISSASMRSSIERANTIPPTHGVAIARARDRAACPSRCNACSKTSIMALSTVSNACRTRGSSRKKSVGKAIRGQVPSISSKCSRER